MSSQEDIQTESPSGSNSKDKMFEPKPKPKMIRVLTVLAYVLSVSMAAILLSIYYIFVWKESVELDTTPGRPNKNKNYMEPKYSHLVSDEGSYHFLNYTSTSFLNDMKYKVPSMDALRMVNETMEDDEVDFSRNARDINVTWTDGKNESDTEYVPKLFISTY